MNNVTLIINCVTYKNNILNISKIESGQLTIISEPVDINNLLKELFAKYEKTVELKKLKLHYLYNCPNDPIQIKSDKNKINQVLCCLLENAIKFTKEGHINFGYNVKGNCIEFYVEDTGIGIAPENHTLIFQQFRQLDSTFVREYEGNGLGLSISKALVEKMGGTISVNSKLGKGSTFIFTIPFKENNKNTNAIALTDETGQDTLWDEKTVLIVEDERSSHAYFEEILATRNVKLVHAWDGREAVEKVKDNTDISLVLMDIKMPIMNGYDALKHIKQIRPKLPVIAQTAYALSHDKTKALQAGFDSYISKPIQKDTLVQIIAGYLT